MSRFHQEQKLTAKGGQTLILRKQALQFDFKISGRNSSQALVRHPAAVSDVCTTFKF